MINSNRELYEKTSYLIETLDLSGHKNLSVKLENALTISSVTGEIMEELKIALICLASSEPIDQLNLRSEVEDCLAYIKQIL